MAAGGGGRRPVQGGAEMSEVPGTRATPQCPKGHPTRLCSSRCHGKACRGGWREDAGSAPLTQGPVVPPAEGPWLPVDQCGSREATAAGGQSFPPSPYLPPLHRPLSIQPSTQNHPHVLGSSSSCSVTYGFRPTPNSLAWASRARPRNDSRISLVSQKGPPFSTSSGKYASLSPHFLSRVHGLFTSAPP